MKKAKIKTAKLPQKELLLFFHPIRLKHACNITCSNIRITGRKVFFTDCIELY